MSCRFPRFARESRSTDRVSRTSARPPALWLASNDTTSRRSSCIDPAGVVEEGGPLADGPTGKACSNSSPIACQRSAFMVTAGTARDAATPRPAAVHARSCRRRRRAPAPFVDAEAGEIAQLDDAALAFVDRGKAGERVVQCQDVIALAGREGEHFVERHGRHTSAAFLAAMPPRMVDENLPHQVRGHAIEMRAAFPFRRVLRYEPHVRLVDQGCRLQSVGGVLVAEVVGGQTTQFVVDDRNQQLESLPLAVLRIPKQQRDLCLWVHGGPLLIGTKGGYSLANAASIPASARERVPAEQLHWNIHGLTPRSRS